jgi:hypothetical protein
MDVSLIYDLQEVGFFIILVSHAILDARTERME